jgi:type I restriction enzyme M protein
VEAGEYLRTRKKEEIFYDKKKKDHYMNQMFHGYDMDRTMQTRQVRYDLMR